MNLMIKINLVTIKMEVWPLVTDFCPFLTVLRTKKRRNLKAVEHVGIVEEITV